jgi:hypothetical protein
MEMPSIKTVVDVPQMGVVFELLAYRRLSESEATGYVRVYLANTKKSKRPKRGQRVTLITTIE